MFLDFYCRFLVSVHLVIIHVFFNCSYFEFKTSRLPLTSPSPDPHFLRPELYPRFDLLITDTIADEEL